ncbi:hypothetical protein CWATWH0402_3454 [Crocosphaera watsonii WH 0402]|uniref:Uncharacterized protein n=1 Tax=Crocosphaera watsonii WH 0402 TaxID=1284629 RepID=T2JXB8_CROWT|nr:hypothetical protein CWATWH0402_3454 [Crocosphaera watsonii WH 0402]
MLREADSFGLALLWVTFAQDLFAMFYQFPYLVDKGRDNPVLWRSDRRLKSNLQRRLEKEPHLTPESFLKSLLCKVEEKRSQIKEEIEKKLELTLRESSSVLSEKEQEAQQKAFNKRVKKELEGELWHSLEQLKQSLSSQNPKNPKNPNLLKAQYSEFITVEYLRAWLSHLAIQATEKIWKKWKHIEPDSRIFFQELSQIALKIIVNPYIFFADVSPKKFSNEFYYFQLSIWSKGKIWREIIDEKRRKTFDTFARSNYSLVDRASIKAIEKALFYAGRTDYLEERLNLIKAFKEVQKANKKAKKEAQKIESTNINNPSFEELKEVINRYEKLTKSKSSFTAQEIKEMLYETGKAIRLYKNRSSFVQSLDVSIGEYQASTKIDRIEDKNQALIEDQDQLIKLKEYEERIGSEYVEKISPVLSEAIAQSRNRIKDQIIYLFWFGLDMKQKEIVQELSLKNTAYVTQRKTALFDRVYPLLLSQSQELVQKGDGQVIPDKIPQNFANGEAINEYKPLLEYCFKSYYQRWLSNQLETSFKELDSLQQKVYKYIRNSDIFYRKKEVEKLKEKARKDEDLKRKAEELESIREKLQKDYGIKIEDCQQHFSEVFAHFI